MKKLAVVLFLIGLALLILPSPAGAIVPPRPEQQRPDIFPCGTGCNLQDYNPTTIKAKATRSIRYRIVTLSGCRTGSIPAMLDRMNREQAPMVGLDLGIDNVHYDFTVYISCGLTQINKCGGTNVFCLPDGYPYNTDVYLSDVLSDWDEGSQVGIPDHEIIAHGVSTWGEQYASCGASCGFQPTPNLVDFMNTGPLSRHGFGAIELERWERTMWLLSAPAPPYQDCTTYPDWPGTTSCFWPALGEWLWTIPLNGHDSLWRWSPAAPQWRCSEGCP